MTDKTKTCDVTVTVSGARGSGKTTLMAVLAQALRGAGHEVDVPDHTPSASRAISDLSLPYRVTFRELEPGQESLTLKIDAGDVSGVVEEAAAQIKALQEAFDLAQQDKAELAITLMERNQALQDLRQRIPDPDAAAALIAKALTFARDSAIIDRDRQEVVLRTESLKQESAKMRRESEARLAEARALMMEALTGRPQAKKTPVDVQMDRRAAARQLSADDKLALANGARPVTTAEQIVAAALSDGEDAPAAGEATLASTIERHLTDGAEHPLIAKLLEGRA